MDNQETIAYFKGKKEGLRIIREELRIFRRRIEEEIKITKEELREWKEVKNG